MSKTLRYLFIFAAILIAIASVWVTNRLTDQLKEEERKKIELWAETIGVMTSQAIFNEEYLVTLNKQSYKGVKQFIDNAFVNYDTLLTVRIVGGNTTIPVIMTDETGEIWTFRNVLPPELENIVPKQDTTAAAQEYFDFSTVIANNRELLTRKLKEFSRKHEPIEIKISDDFIQRVYYDDSTVLKQLQIFPYVQLCVVFIFILVSFIALNSTKKAEQNRVWVGLSKETAHQLGTPISSLMAWLEYLKAKDVEPKLLAEIDKDVQRLKTIAERFSKIGSVAKPEPMDLREGVTGAVEYLSRRISSKVVIRTDFPEELQIKVLISESLFGWVIENLVKNAADAMDGQGTIHISAVLRRKKALLNITDTGKGIPKSKFETVFHPGYTTKQRGWGLGLSLAKRIIESYHKGKIYVAKSEVGKGTTFRIELKTVNA
ncbi:MAG: HAMP domain-containing histidine kinase [Dysgonamonadaceae bacterium]|nr:HAMP domain-containing histidine kinase [Dysgonamonadaceae bacterium]